MIGSAGLALRPSSTAYPLSNASGMATSKQRAPAKFAAASTSLVTALPRSVSTPSCLQGVQRIRIGVDHQHRDSRLDHPRRDVASDPAIAEQDHVIGQAVVTGIGSRGARACGFPPFPSASTSLSPDRRSSIANRKGLSRIERIAPASTRSRALSGSSANATPSPTRMKENSPICARLAEIVSAVDGG